MLIYILISFVNEINKRRASIFVRVKCNSGNKGKNEISQQQVRMGTKSRPVIIVDYKHAAWLARCGARGPQFATFFFYLEHSKKNFGVRNRKGLTMRHDERNISELTFAV